MSIQNWTIVALREGKTTDNPHGGKLTAYYCDMVGEDQEQQDDVYWRRKEGNVPPVNEQVFGEVSQGEYGPRFKLVPKDGGSFQNTPSASGGAQQSGARDAYWEKREQRDIEGVKRMGRAHAQEMALRMVETTRDAADLDLTDKDTTGIYLNEVVKRLTNWFEQDVNRSTVPPPEPAPPAPTDQEKIL